MAMGSVAAAVAANRDDDGTTLGSNRPSVHTSAAFEEKKVEEQNGSSIEPVPQDILPGQARAARVYNSDPCQIGVAILIAANFLTNVLEKEWLPEDGTTAMTVFRVLEVIYNIAFTVELAINMYGHWFCPFWQLRWNIFDVVVVTIGIVDMLQLPLPSFFKLLRMVRAFKVFRLFRRIDSLNKIIVSITRAVPGVANAFLILAIIMAIFAILAVEFYKDVGADCLPGSAWMTNRDFCMGNEYFGTFSKSYYTMFQVLTGDSWSENIARPCIFYFDNWTQNLGGGLFFVGFVLITTFVLQNVVVAVLLDQMVDPSVDPQKLTDDQQKIAADLCRMQGVLNRVRQEHNDLRGAFVTARSDVSEVKASLAVIKQAMTKKFHVSYV